MATSTFPKDSPREKRMPEEAKQAANRRVLSGMRPTGKLHIGHYVGALQNWIRLQNDYECFFFAADWHALTTDYADTSRVKNNIFEMVFDWLAAGLDPEKATIFIQSHVPQHAELHLLLSMMTPLGWLERVPTYKDQKEQLKEKDLNTYGFLGYPLLQSADILLYKAAHVPVGEDQVAHVEITREIARRFNQFYPARGGNDVVVPSRDVFPEPHPLKSAAPKLPGTDGRKMSKSYGNSILLSDPEAEVRKKLKTMVTDPARIRRTDVGNPDICPVGDLHKIFSSAETMAEVRQGCTTAGIGCIQCKGWVADNIVAMLNPIQERRRSYENNPRLAWDILEAGSARARKAADATLAEVRVAMGMSLGYEYPESRAPGTVAE
jgi:tryptophanyl-tRNA synthetase